MNTPDQQARPETLQQLHEALVQGIVAEHGLTEQQAKVFADTFIKVLQIQVGGERVGRRGIYVQTYAYAQRARRDQLIVRLAGESPRSWALMQQIAKKAGCHVTTVLRVLERAEAVKGERPQTAALADPP